MSIQYKQHRKKLFEITGEVEKLSAVTDGIYFLTSKPRQKRECIRVITNKEIVKLFIPHLYKIVTAKFSEGKVEISQ